MRQARIVTDGGGMAVVGIAIGALLLRCAILALVAVVIGVVVTGSIARRNRIPHRGSGQ